MAQITVFCAHCGAANETDATACFACGRAPGKPESTAREAEAQLVKERYRPVRQVGTGGFGAVYLAEDLLAGKKQVALKEIRLAGLSAQEMIEATDAFNREVSLLPGLRHGHLPRVHDHFTDAQHWYVIMEFIAGETLESYVQRIPSGRLPVEMVLDMGIQLADVLDYLHSRQPPIIFRDLKPANIMRTPEGKLYLIDFGIARIFKPGQPRDTIAFGSPGYAPPEQYGKAQTTARSDLYSLGATLHFLLSGDDPANTPFSFAPFAPSLSAQPGIAPLQRLIMQMVELDVAKRPESVLAVKRELQEIATQLLQERLRSLRPIDRPSSSFIQPYVPSSQIGGSGQGQIQMGLPAQKATAKQGQTRRRFIRVAAGAILTTIAAGGIAQLLGSLESQDSQPAPTMDSPAQPTQFAFGNAPVGHTYYTYTEPNGAVAGVSWSPNGSYILMGGYSRAVRIFRVDGWVNILSQDMNQGAILAVAWSPNDYYVASASKDGTVQVWQAPTALSTINTTYEGHRAQVNAISWSPDNQFIASASDDGTVQVFHVIERPFSVFVCP
jgi:serine/threonine protein kinase